MAEFNIDNPLGIPSAANDDSDIDAALRGAPVFTSDPPVGAEDSDVDEALGITSAAKVNVGVSRDTSADENAKRRDNARKVGVSPEAAELSPSVVQGAADDQDVDNALATSPATTRFLKDINNAKVAHDAVEDLGLIERLSRGFQRGRMLSELGHAGVALRREPTSEESKARVAGLQKRLQALGKDTEGFVSGLAGVMEFFGQRVASLSRPEAAATVAKGGVAGAAVGLAGGPLAPFTVPAATTAGLISGLTAHSIKDIGEVEAGLSYVEQLEAGVDPNIAYWTSLGVGLVNAGLETLGGASFLRPLTRAGKAAFKAGLRGVVKNPKFLDAAKNLVVNYGANVAIETTTEILQEVVNIAAEELGKELTEGKSAEFTPEKWTERLTEIAIKTLKTTALLAGPGNTYAFARDIHRARKADANVKQLDEIRKALEASPLTPRSPDQAAEHVAESFAEAGVTEVYIPVEALQSAAIASGDTAKFFDDLRVTDQIDDAETFGGDVRISVKAFSEHVLQTDAYAGLKEHVRLDEDSLTQAEAREYEEFYDNEDMGALEAIPEADEVSRDTSVELAEHEMGMQALFRTAHEAGFTEGQYASYLEAVLRAREVGARRKERTRLKRQQKKNEIKYQERREAVKLEEEAAASQEPTFQAFLSIGRERLDYQETLDLLGGDEEALQRLPRFQGRRIYAPKGQKGSSPHVLADVYGLGGADIMIFDWLDKPTFEQEVNQRADARMEQEQPTLVSERQEIEEALEALHTDNYGDVLAYELNWMRQARKQKRLKPALVKARAREIILNYKISDISVRSLEAAQKREAARARKAVREGDLEAAATAKLNQLVAFHMTKEAYKIREEVSRGNKFMGQFLSKRKRFPSLPVDFLTNIKEVLAGFQFGPRLSDKSKESLNEWAQRKAEEEGVPVQIPQVILDADGSTNFRDLTLEEWRILHNTVRGLHHEGVTANKLRLETEKATVQETVDGIIVGIEENLTLSPVAQAEAAAAAGEVTVDIPLTRTFLNKVKEAKDKFNVNVASIFLNTDSILRNIDGFKSLGTAYRHIKGGIDRAITEGYLPGQVGYTARLKNESERLLKVYDAYSKTERNTMGVIQQDIPGVRRRLTRLEQIGVLLNMGNAGNMRALIDSGEFTAEELQAIIGNARKKDLDFAQNVWDFWEDFWPEIKGTVKRRQNRIPERVEAVQLETQHGTYRGGYHPLQYDSARAVLRGEVGVEEAIGSMLSGGFTAGHTQDGHAVTRKSSGGRPVKIDPFVINNHLQQLVYDLEVGDAVHDAYKVLHHKDLKQAFSDAGQAQVWDALDIWFGDQVTGEIHRGSLGERAVRHIRTGTTISSLAFNLSVAALQPLGLLQSAALVGKKNMLLGLYDLVSQGKNMPGMYAWVTDQSGMMRERERSFNKDIVDASRGLTTGVLAKITPGRTAEFVAETAFLPIAKMQRFVDIVTWLGAKRQGLEMFPGDDAKSTTHADRMVVRTQGSGNFQERTGFERGTVSKNVRNSEWIRQWSLFLNYFAAKLNVAYERTKTTNFRSPLQVADYASDMVMLFVIEGLLASIIKEGWPDDDEEGGALAKRALRETAKTFLAGVPVVRDIAADAEGFNTGGALGSFAGKVAAAGKQISQAEVDAALIKSLNNVGGVLFKYPTSQVHKTGQAIYDNAQEEEIEFIDYIMGPRFNK